MMKARRVACVTAGIFSLLLGGSLEAGENKWTSQGPFSGAVTALATDPQTATPDITVFAGIDGAGVFRTNDNGDSWAADNAGLTDLRVQDLKIAVDILVEPTASEPSHLYAATNGGGIFRAVVTAPGVPLAWASINGTSPTDLKNLFVLSVEIDPNQPNIIYAGTNGGGTFRSQDFGATWEEINEGLGQRVVFDLDIPIPVQLDIVINEVDADIDGSGIGIAADVGEFIELKGQPNTSVSGLSLVFYNAEGFIGCPGIDGDMEIDAYDFVDLSGRFDTNGLFVVANDPGVLNADLVAPFDLRDNTIGVTLRSGPGAFYFGTHADELGLIDMAIYGVAGSPFNRSIQSCLGLDLSGSNQTYDTGAGTSIGRSPDGGEQETPSLFAPQTPTPGQLNVPVEHLYAATDLNGMYRTDTRRGAVDFPEWFPVNNNLGSSVVFAFAYDGTVPSGEFCGLLGQSTPYAGTSNAGVDIGTDPCDLGLLEDWMPFSEGLPGSSTIPALEVAQPIGGTSAMVFAGTEEGKIFRRVVDTGDWEEVFNGLSGLQVSTLEVYRRDGVQMVFAGTANDIQSDNPPPEGLGGAVFGTVDAGANWFQTGPRIDAINGIYSEDIVIDPIDPMTVYVGTFSGGVFKSTDGGQNWVEKNIGIPTSVIDGISRFIFSMAIDPLTPTTLYAGTDLTGAFKSTDGGDTWFAINTGFAVGNVSVRDIEIDPTDTDTLYAATGRLYKSTDGGTSWALAITGFPANTTVIGIEIDPVDPLMVYAATENKGLFKTIDGGATWDDANVGLTETFIRSLALDPNNNTSLYAGTDGGGLFKTADGALNWLPINEGLENLFVLSVAIDEMSPPVAGAESQILYVGTSGGGIFRSTDAGAAWAPFNTGLTNLQVKDIAIDPTDSRIRYAATSGGGVFDFREVERVTIEPSSGLITTELGGTATFTAVLTAAPIADVTMKLRSSNVNEGTVEPEEILFTPSNGLLPQTIVITGVDDGVLDSDQAYVVITEPLESFDTRFDGVDPIDVSVINVALLPEVAGVSVNPAMGLMTDENGGQDTFAVVLTSTPTADVTISLSSLDPTEGTVSPAVLTFTPINARTSQVVTVTGVNDGIIDGDQLFTIALDPATSSDVSYNGLDPNDVTVVNLDNGVATTTLFETATLGATGQSSAAGFIANTTAFIGAKFTVAQTVDVAGLGGHFVGFGGASTIFVAIVPLLGGSDLPATPFNPANAVFGSSMNVPALSSEVLVNANFQLTPGRYGILFGSGAFGAAGTAIAPGNDTDIGFPEYFASTNGGNSYTNGGLNNVRFFVIGDVAPGPSQIFTDGFESGNLLSWSATVP